MTSVKGNIILSVINTVVTLLFPLVTFPYVSRILMPDGIGIVQFYQSIINYIVLLSALGIPLYAVREIARFRDNVELRNRATLEILSLHAILSFFGYLVVFLLIATVGKIRADWPLFLLLSLSIFLNVIGVSWFYQAMEQFKYVTVRSLIVKTLAAVALFCLVRSSNDLYYYAGILVCAEAGNYIFNFIRLRKYVHFNSYNFKDLDIRRHLVPTFRIFMLNFAISIYVNLNPIMLGFMANDAAVGYYTAATKIIKAANGLTIALGNAILPRLSNYFATGKLEEYAKIKKKTLNIIMMLCLPITICTAIIAHNLIPVFSGNEYYPAILTLQLSSPAILISAFNYIIAIQILYSQNKEKIVIIATSVGALVNVISNFILIPHLQQDGAAISGCLAELSVLIVCCLLGYSYIRYNVINKNNLQVLLASAVCGCAVWITGLFCHGTAIAILILQFCIGVIIYVFILLCQKNQLFCTYSYSFIQKCKRISIRNI